MKLQRDDIATPANLISLIGLVLVIIGTLNLTTWTGLILLAIGRFLDIADGYVARRTHTSDFGAAVDATTDKLTIVLIIIALLRFDLAPLWVILYILVQNVLVATIAVAASRRYIQLKTSFAGKRNMFLQNIAMLFFAWSALVSGSAFTIVFVISYAVLIASIPLAIKATAGYYATVRNKKN